MKIHVEAIYADIILKDENPWEAMAKVLSEESQVYKWRVESQKRFRASRMDHPHHPQGSEAVPGHQPVAGQGGEGGVHNQVDLLPRKEDQRCPASNIR